jgi:3-deoxy-manno-octulosonate cytidylyltransferase (CMP-KDO synthetase)
LERAEQASRLEQVVVATDDHRIREAVEEHGGTVVMTSPDHVSGTDRVAEAARGLEGEIVLNIQGDEMLLEPESLNRLVEALEEEPDLGLATLRIPASDESMMNPNSVKIVCNSRGEALYFSRAAIPHPFRNAETPRWSHVGVYAFRRRQLMEFTTLPPTPLELQEGLEQLRALENGWRVKTIDAEGEFLEVNTPADLEHARQMMENNG